MRANTKYKRGYENHATKIDEYGRDKIKTLDAYRESKIEEIDNQIEALKKQRSDILKKFSKKQMALDFGVHPQQIRRILKGEFR